MLGQRLYQNDSNEKIDKFKDRYEPKKFKQSAGIEYSDTFTPTSKSKTNKFLTALTANENFF